MTPGNNEDSMPAEVQEMTGRVRRAAAVKRGHAVGSLDEAAYFLYMADIARALTPPESRGAELKNRKWSEALSNLATAWANQWSLMREDQAVADSIRDLARERGVSLEDVKIDALQKGLILALHDDVGKPRRVDIGQGRLYRHADGRLIYVEDQTARAWDIVRAEVVESIDREELELADVALGDEPIPVHLMASWLRRRAMEQAIDVVQTDAGLDRQAVPPETALLAESESVDSRPTIEARLLTEEAWAAAGLTQAQAEAVRLHAIEGLTFEEVADRTSKASGTVKSHYHRGMLKLKKAV